MNKNLIRLRKTIAHALRHKPEEYGLTAQEGVQGDGSLPAGTQGVPV